MSEMSSTIGTMFKLTQANLIAGDSVVPRLDVPIPVGFWVVWIQLKAAGMAGSYYDNAICYSNLVPSCVRQRDLTDAISVTPPLELQTRLVDHPPQIVLRPNVVREVEVVRVAAAAAANASARHARPVHRRHVGPAGQVQELGAFLAHAPPGHAGEVLDARREPGNRNLRQLGQADRRYPDVPEAA